MTPPHHTPMTTPPAASADFPDTPQPESPALPVRGVDLEETELAALLAVLATAASAATDSTDAGGTGPADRALQRRHRLDQDQHGLWGRPGRGSWNHATGGLR